MNTAGADQVPQVTYPEIGATAGTLPPGYHHSHHCAVVGHGREEFERAAQALRQWQVHRRSGLRIDERTPAVAVGVDVVMRLGFGRLAIGIPCRVVYVVNEPNRQGFAYGTLPGHPETGEERFVLDRADDGTVTFEMAAFSRPGRWYTRVAGPVGRLAQRLALRRYAWACARCISSR